MSRSSTLAQRFAVGKTVVVGSTLPNIRDWPGISENMHQFFCGEELTVIGHVYHPDDPSRLAVMLNTKEFGSTKNFLFSTEWLSIAGEAKLKPVVAPITARKRARKAKVADEQERIADIKKAIKQSMGEDIPLNTPITHAKPQSEKLAEPVDFGWGAALGGALATAIGMAIANKRTAGKADGVTPDIQTVAKTVEVQNEVTVTR